LFSHVVIAKPLHTFARHALALQNDEKRQHKGRPPRRTRN
jgi:hypothetical protein